MQEGLLRLYELRNSIYIQRTNLWLSELEISLSLWKGKYEGRQETWLRWRDRNGKLILTGAESTKQERLAKERAKERVKKER